MKKELMESRNWELAKEVAKVVCKTMAPRGELIAEAMDMQKDEEDKKRVEKILEIITEQGKGILEEAQERRLESVEQLELLWYVPGIKEDLERLSQSLQQIEGWEAFFSKEEPYKGQKEFLREQEEINGMIKELQEEVEEFRQQHGMGRYRELADALSIRPGEERMVQEFLKRFRQIKARTGKKEGGKMKLGGLQIKLGGLLSAIGEKDEAEKVLLEAQKEAKGEQKAWASYNRFVNFLEKREWERAFSCYKEAVKRSQEFQLFEGRKYHPQRILGADGFGVMFLCKDILKGEVVVKALYSLYLKKSLDRAIKEIGILARLGSPYIIKVYDYGYVDWEKKKNPYVVMEYFKGKNLDAYIEEHGAFSLRRGLEIAKSIGEGIHAAHEKGVIHRNLKPANVLYRGDGYGFELKIIDFGFAVRHRYRKSEKELKGNGEHSIIGESILGILQYASPEQLGKMVDGKRWKVGKQSNVYSYGKILKKVFFGTLTPHPQQIKDFGNEQLLDLIGECEMANPQQRPRDFEEILERLEKIMAKERIGDGGDEESLSFPVIFQSQKNKEKKEHSEEERKRKDWLSHCAIAKLGRMVYEYDGMVMLDMAGNAWKELDYAKHVEYAREYQIAYAKSLRLPVERDFTIKGTTFRLVLIPPGRFLMGSPESELERYKDESPQHRVIISKPFWLGKYEVTQAQWKAVMGENPSYFESAGKKAPVEKVSWHDCQDLCQKLSNASGEKICLPTEAQWEYACRAGTLTPFNLGDNITPEQVNYNGNYPYPGGKRGKYRETTVAVGSLPNANAWGLYDMHGNVWEWCADSCTWDRNKWIVRTDTYIDGIGDPLCENGPRRIVRGGSCFYIAGLCRCAFRDSKPPSTHDDYGGMRLCIKVNSNSPC